MMGDVMGAAEQLADIMIALIVLFGVEVSAIYIAKRISRLLPDSDRELRWPFTIPIAAVRLFKTRLIGPGKSLIAASVDTALPEWASRDGYRITAETARGLETLSTCADAIPNTLWRRWNGVGVWVVAIFVGVWIGIASLFGFVFLGRLLTHIQRMPTYAGVAFDALSQPATAPPAPLIDPVSVIVATLSVALALIAAACIYVIFFWLAMIVLAPEIFLHEVGHAIAMRKHGVEIDCWGVILIGPVPLAAFVKDGGDYRTQLDWRRRLDVASAGILHSVAWGAVIGLVALSFTAGTVQFVLLILAGVHFFSGVLNAVPLPYVDGGHFVGALWSEWLGVGNFEVSG